MNRSGRMLLLALVLGCDRGGKLNTAQASLHFAPNALALTAYVGAKASGDVVASNTGAGGDTVSVSIGGDSAFAVTPLGSLALGAGATQPLRVTFTPSDAGSAGAVLTLVDSLGSTAVALTGTALADLACPPNDPCDQAVFDADAGSCRRSALADGTPCVSPELCLDHTKCIGGACLGDPKTCDDGNACTTDYCLPADGCHHDDNSQRCIGTEACHIYACDPLAGCTDDQAANGTPCANGIPCQTADVCFGGSCQGFPIPDGTPCKLWWEPCVSDSACHGGMCSSPTADAEQPGQLRWDAGLGGPSAGPFTVDDTGVATYVTFPLDGGSVLSALDACGKPLWVNGTDTLSGVLLDSDQLIGWTGGGQVFGRVPLIGAASSAPMLVGLDPGSGERVWSTDVAAAVAPFLLDAGLADAGLYLYGPPAMSNQGLLVLPLRAQQDQQLMRFNGFVAGFDRAGHLAWVASLGGPSSAFLGNLAIDALGDVWVVGYPGQDSRSIGLLLLSPTGKPLWESALPEVASQKGIAAAADFVFIEGAGAGFSLDGGLLYQAPPLGGGPCSSGAVIDPNDNVYAPGVPDGGPVQSGSAIDKRGNLLWTIEQSFSNPVLADDGTIFTTGADLSCVEDGAYSGLNINAFAPDGGLLWATGVTLVGLAPQIALTPTASIEAASGDQALALFAGKVHVAGTAPWSRAQGGDNRNRSCVLPASVGP